MQAPVGLLEHLRALAEGQPVGAVFLHGDHGVGKTHLLVAACAAAGALGHKPAYLGLKHLRGRLAAACEGLDNAALVAVDDVDAIAGAREDEVALFHLHNRLRDAGSALLYAATTAPDSRPLALPDLRSRFAQCTRWSLPQLEDVYKRQDQLFVVIAACHFGGGARLPVNSDGVLAHILVNLGAGGAVVDHAVVQRLAGRHIPHDGKIQ